MVSESHTIFLQRLCYDSGGSGEKWFLAAVRRKSWIFQWSCLICKCSLFNRSIDIGMIKSSGQFEVPLPPPLHGTDPALNSVLHQFILHSMCIMLILTLRLKHVSLVYINSAVGASMFCPITFKRCHVCRVEVDFFALPFYLKLTISTKLVLKEVRLVCV